MFLAIKKSIRLSALLALTALAATSARAQNTITLNIGTSPDLLNAFAKADADPNNYYEIWLARRQDAQGNIVKWTPTQTFTLTKGKVIIHGSTSLNYPERYTFDGQGARRLFLVKAASGFAPRLKLTGIQVQNGNAGFGQDGGGLASLGASRVEVTFCKFLNNTSNQPGSGISIRNTDYVLILHDLIDGNKNDQGSGCGGGETDNGGGLSIANDFSAVVGATVSMSTISHNIACRGGGVVVSGNVNITVVNSTISDNEAYKRGGGIFFRNGSGNSMLRFNTIAFNKAGTALGTTEGRYGGGFGASAYFGTLNFQGNILAKNQVVNHQAATRGVTGDDCYTDGGSLSTILNGQNIIGEIGNCSQYGNAGSWGIGSDNKPFDPKLNSTLETSRINSGFGMAVHMTQSDSPGRLNFFAASGNACESYEEREYPRPSAPTKCDIGAVELFSDVGFP